MKTRLSPVLASALAALALGGCGPASASEDGAVPLAAPSRVSVVSADALAQQVAGGEVQLIDVRTAEEFAQGHIAGAINIPLDRFDPAALPATDGKTRVLYCRSGRRSGIAAERLVAAGAAEARHLDGGILAWEAAGHPIGQ